MAELTSNKKLIVIVGPTAVGKTSLSIELAKKLDCPILSFDSRQFYQETSIGTAKPSQEELEQAEHHFISCRSIEDEYTAGMFETDAIQRLNDIYSKHDICVAVGGSGLYANALCYGIDDIPSDKILRDELEVEWKNQGLTALQEELKEVDPEYYATADIQNPRRVMRAIEVFRLSGKPYSHFRKSTHKERSFDFVLVGLEDETETLYQRINQRVDLMLDNGLIEEAKSVYPKRHLKALKTVGYQELFSWLDEEISQEKAIELIKRNSRRYARKQMSWFKRNKDIKWFNVNSNKEIIQYLQSIKWI